MNSIQTRKRERRQLKKSVPTLEDFKEATYDFPMGMAPPQFLGSQDPDPESFKNAVDGILGLASLISNSDFDTPPDWVQPYSIVQKDHSTLPTGIRLTTQKLLRASYEVYYSVRSNS